MRGSLRGFEVIDHIVQVESEKKSKTESGVLRQYAKPKEWRDILMKSKKWYRHSVQGEI